MEQVSAIRGHHIRCVAPAGSRSRNGALWNIHSFIRSFIHSCSLYYLVVLNVFPPRTIHMTSQLAPEVGFLPKEEKLVWYVYMLGKYPGTRIVPECKAKIIIIFSIKNTGMNLCRKASRLADWRMRIRQSAVFTTIRDTGTYTLKLRCISAIDVYFKFK
jgi:hypothetical protein